MPPSPALTRTHYTTCNLCEAMCGVRIDLEEGRITSIRGDERDPLSHGHICPKAVALKDLHDDPDRLRHPVRKRGSGWERIGWDEAFDEASRALSSIRAEHGRDAVGVYLGNPTVHNLGALLYGPLFLRSLRTKNRFSATSVDQLPHMLVAYLMFGHQLLFPIPDIDHTQYMLMLGANPVASNGSLMTAPGIRARMKALAARGGKLVVVDPRRSETARLASEHVFIRPGTDALFLFALLHELLEKGPRLGRLSAFASGLEELQKVAKDFTPERAALHTGVPAEQIRRIAGEFAAAEGAVCYGRVGTSTQAFGSICQWLINAINIVSGNLDRRGGAMFTRPAFDLLGLPRGLSIGRGSFGRWKSRVRGLPEFGGELPAPALAEEILTEGSGKIRALITFAGNPVLSTPNGGKLDKALASLDFMVSVDPYINETTRHAKLILPPPSPLERAHYDVIFHLLAVRNTAKYSPPLFDTGQDARHDWQILLELMKRLDAPRGKAERLLHGLKYKALERIGPERILDIGLRLGPYGARAQGLSLARLEREPHGVDLGPLEPCLPERLGHHDKRIHLAPAQILADLERLAAAFPADERRANEGELLLIGRRHLRDNNSWMHNAPMLMTGKPRCTLMMHPDDAGRLGISGGDEVVVRSRVGEAKIAVQLTDEMMPGVVSLPHGYGHGRRGVELRVARAHAGASLNDLTDDQAVDAPSGVAAFSGTPVRVERARTENRKHEEPR